MKTARRSRRRRISAILSKLLTLSGLSEQDAAARAALCAITAEKAVTKASYDPQDYGDVDKINNIYSFSAIEKQFPNVDLRAVFAASWACGDGPGPCARPRRDAGRGRLLYGRKSCNAQGAFPHGAH